MNSASSTSRSGYYFVDPDGPLTGMNPIRVYCQFESGIVLTKFDTIDDKVRRMFNDINKGS